MNIERSTPIQLGKSPIEPENVQLAINWIYEKIPYERYRKHELAELRDTAPELNDFIMGMGVIRRSIDLRGARELASYHNGALFMLRALGEKVRATSNPTSDTMREYFFQLAGRGYLDHEIEILAGNQKLLKKTDASLEPFAQRLITEPPTDESELIRENIRTETSIRKYDMLEAEPYMKEILIQGSFVRKFGPLEGLHIGATDVYEVFKAQQSSDNLSRMWDIKPNL